MRLKNRVAMITGAGGPMGRAIALRFAEEGANLVLTDISERRLEETKQILTVLKKDVIAVRSNVLNYDEVKSVVANAYTHMDKIDILINVVGGIRSQPMNQSILEIDGDRWDDTMALNMKGSVNCIQLVAPQMIKGQYGKIVNISSIGFAGEAGLSDYGAAKAGVASLTKTAAIELSPYVNVNCIAPGIIQTSITTRMEQSELESYRNQTLTGRLGEPIDIANTALFLSNEESRNITGQIIAVSGGISPHL
ncbi:SDR family NAD(P)-dependent oxidoreductase [Psychrobacillus sp. NPDC096426]|uniref:SDR family NAD(P)-dependent oxidoreductase n=1 Tax=Psychrobacillus sp. NPDC096426 TaxID=3364491 RepID=UPI0038010D01